MPGDAVTKAWGHALVYLWKVREKKRKSYAVSCGMVLILSKQAGQPSSKQQFRRSSA